MSWQTARRCAASAWRLSVRGTRGSSFAPGGVASFARASARSFCANPTHGFDPDRAGLAEYTDVHYPEPVDVVCARKMQVVDAGYLRDFGGVKRFSGPAVTIQCFENNPLVRQALGEPGEGRVLVVDGGGSTRCALLGDNLAAMAANNGWSGVIINGCLRDTEDIAKTSVGVKAIAPHPVKSSKRDRACATSPSRSRGHRPPGRLDLRRHGRRVGRWTGKVHVVRGEATGEEGTRDDP